MVSITQTSLDVWTFSECRRYLAEILPIRRKTLYNQSINHISEWNLKQYITGFYFYFCCDLPNREVVLFYRGV